MARHTSGVITAAPAPSRAVTLPWLQRLLARSVPLQLACLNKADWLFLAAVFLLTRLGVIGAALLGTYLFPQLGPHQSLAVQPIGTPGGGDWTRLFAHFDSGYYLGISHAYLAPSSGKPFWLAEWAFFPFYPMLLHPVAVALSALHLSLNVDLLAGVLVSHAALFAALVYLYRLAAADVSPAAGRRSILYIAIFPASLFFSMVYPESLFLLACVAAFYHARRRQWLFAGAFTAAALLTRPQGLFLLVPLALEFADVWRDEGWQLTRRTLHGVWLALPLVAFAGYALYSRAITGYWLAFSVSASQAWGHRLTPPVFPLIHYLLAPTFSGFLAYDFQPANFLCALLFLTLVVVAWRRLSPTYALWLLIAILFPLSTNGHSFFSFARYVSTAFPAFIALAAWSLGERRTASGTERDAATVRRLFAPLWLRHAAIVFVSVPLLALYVVLWVNGFPAAI